MPNVEDFYPLSPMQQGMLFHSTYAPESGVYVEQLGLTLRGNLDTNAFARAWQQMIDRHAILRTAFIVEDLKEPVQVVHRHVQLPLEQDDWRALSPDEQRDRLASLRQAERRRGFTIAQPPLMRLCLLRTAEDTYEFVWTYHHALLDGWSGPLLFQELFACYAAFRLGKSPYLEPPRRYRDYIAWLRRQDMAAAEAFWRRELAGFSAPTPLMVDRLPHAATDAALPAEQADSYIEHETTLPAPVTQALQTLARQHRLTINTLVQGAWALLLSRYSGEEDVLFGATVSGRPTDLPGAETMIGLFINTLPVRVRVPPDVPFLRWLQELQARQVELRQYEYTPLVQIQAWSEVPRGQNLFESILVFENYPIASAVSDQDDQLIITQLHSVEQTNYPITLVAGIADELVLKIACNTRHFDTATIERMLGHLRTILAGFAADPHQPLATVPLLTEAERQQILVAWNATAAPYPDDQCVHQLFEQQAARTPDAVAVVFEGQRLTYRELNRRANQLAHYLQTLGVGPETLVGIGTERSPEMIIGVLGVLKAGGAYLPLDPTYPPARLAFMLADARVTVLLTQRSIDPRSWTTDHRPPTTEAEPHGRADGHAPRATRHAPRATIVALDADWPTIAREPDTNPAGSVLPDHLAYVIYTSGSTGQPKGVAIAHRGVANLAGVLREHFAIQPTSRVLQFAAFGFDAAVAEIVMTLLHGASLYLAPRATLASPPALLAFLRRHAITTLTLPPALLAVLPADDLPALHTVASAGERCPWDVAQRWAAGRRFLNGYGPTETTVAAAYYLVTHPLATASVPIGRPLANTQVYLLDRHQQPVPIGVPGEIHIGGVGLARGYLHRPDLTAATFVPNPFAAIERESGEHGRAAAPHATAPHRPTAPPPHRPTATPPQLHTATAPQLHTPPRLYRTGDRARYLPDGNLEFLGRLDHQVKLRGFRIELGEIEAVLRQHPAVQDAVVLARADTPGDKRLVAYVVPTTGPRAGGDGPPTTGSAVNQQPTGGTGELRAFLAENLPEYMLPTAFVVLDRLPLTPNGKVDRQALPPPDGGRPDLAVGYVAPTTGAEARLAGIWTEVLGIDQVGRHDNFFELGGDSILSIQVIARATQAGLRLNARQFFQHPTIAELAAVANTTEVTPAEQGVVTGPVPLTPIQRWFFEHHPHAPHHWNMSILLEVWPPMDVTLLEQTVQHLLAHHDALRMRFYRTDTGWRQEHAPVDAAIPFTRIDVSHLAPRKQRQAIEAEAAALQTSLHLEQGPLLRVAYFDLGEGRSSRLLILCHHLVVDGVSFRILLEDLQTAYHQLSRGESVTLPPKTTSFQHWSERLVQYAQSATVRQELDYWTQLTRHPVPALPVDDADGANTYGLTEPVAVSLNPEETRALLHDVPAAYGTQINAVLLTALALAFARWTKQRRLLIEMEGHGREDILEGIDVSRTVGWFTTAFPVLLDVQGTAGREDALRMVQTQLREIPNHGIGYGLLRYACEDDTTRARMQALSRPEINFNYLGQFDQDVATTPVPSAGLLATLVSAITPGKWQQAPENTSPTTPLRLARESRGPQYHPDNPRSALLYITGSISGGELNLLWLYSPQVHKRSTIKRLAQNYLKELRSLIALSRIYVTIDATPGDTERSVLVEEE